MIQNLVTQDELNANCINYDDSTTELGSSDVQEAIEKLTDLANGKVRVVEATISGTTDDKGNLGVGNKMVVMTKFAGHVSFPYYHGTYGTYIHFQRWDGTSETSTSVSGSYFYLA